MPASAPDIDVLEHLSISQLRQHYKALLGATPPERTGRQFLKGNIAWTLQVRDTGKDPAKVREQLTAAAGRQAISPKTRYLPGTRLIREWQGVTHEVVVEESGYRWRNRHFRSLSHIAREITGARWSGLRFFGLPTRSSSGAASGGFGKVNAAFSDSRSPIRCVIYTRKSSEEGLEQDFNSLDAQREACEAYIRSQAHEGWVLLDHRYDDGGFSGGSMNRPALERLMADIATGTVDLIVVYKVDRLSRSLADFSKMVETFDQYGVSFVSITQQFNTSTSMGRLTLNVLLSFAQFEREVTGERIRDKIAASKKKGMWMGGTVPLGYDNRDRTLVINAAEAERVRHIYRRYLELGSVKLLKEELDRQGIRGKARRKDAGSQPLSRGALYALLRNPLYIGKVRHKEQLHRGAHDPIIDRHLWDAVQGRLSENRHANYLRTQAAEPSLLAGLLFDEFGHPLSPTHTRKKSRRYRYYVNQTIVQFKQKPVDALSRVPARTVEYAVEAETCRLLGDPGRLLHVLAPLALPAPEQQTLVERATQRSETWEGLDASRKVEYLSIILRKVTLARSTLTVTFSLPGIVRVLLRHDKYQGEATHEVRVPVTLKRCGVETKLLVEPTGGHNNLKPHPDSLRAIQEALRKALLWNQALMSGAVNSTKLLAEESVVSQRYVAQLIKLAYLSPDITQRILKGDIPHGLTLGKLKTGIPLDWKDQEAIFS